MKINKMLDYSASYADIKYGNDLTNEGFIVVNAMANTFAVPQEGMKFWLDLDQMNFEVNNNNNNNSHLLDART